MIELFIKSNMENIKYLVLSLINLALSFHHRENTKKCFSLSASAFSSKPINILQIEADKCDLLCSNCHLELHYPQYNL